MTPPGHRASFSVLCNHLKFLPCHMLNKNDNQIHLAACYIADFNGSVYFSLSSSMFFSCTLNTCYCRLQRKVNLCGILLKRPCPRSWNLLSQACVMWLHPALPSSAPSLLVSGDFMWEKDKPRTPFPLILRCLDSFFFLALPHLSVFFFSCIG